jgi:CubicO group peptidase (beta-lactamase class C family)
VTFDRARGVLDDAIAARVTPGAQLSVRWRERGGWQRWGHACGGLDYEHDAAVTLETPYDLASVTKAFVALALVRAASRGALRLDATIGSLLDETKGQPIEHATLEQLASHRAQLPAWKPFYQQVRAGERGRVIELVAATPLEPCDGARYSDLGYILLGEALARHLGPSFVRDEVTAPLNLSVAWRGVGPRWIDATVAPTERCPWRGRVVQGEVHDENAFAMRGFAGHAGLFGTARDLAELGRASLDALAGDADWFAPDAMRAMVSPRPGGSHRLGWDGKSAESSSAGTSMSTATFGHLGFTGTSLWCDPEAGVAVALVTNRVHPSRDNLGIRTLRPALHDAVMTELLARRPG